jgi:chromosome segregation ATPase
VIEKLMTDNDRLKRELKEQVIKGEELQRGIQMAKPRIDALQAENDNLTHARGVDSALLARRDRMISELKADLAAERKRRELQEARSQQLETERDDAIEEKRRDIQELTESEKHATTHASILETSHKQLSATYRARLEATRKEITALRELREGQEARIAKLDVVSDQMRQEAERSRRVQAEMLTKWEGLSSALQERLDAVWEEKHADSEKMKALSKEMDDVVKKMRWVMNLKQNTELGGNSKD